MQTQSCSCCCLLKSCAKRQQKTELSRSSQVSRLWNTNFISCLWYPTCLDYHNRRSHRTMRDLIKTHYTTAAWELEGQEWEHICRMCHLQVTESVQHTGKQGKLRKKQSASVNVTALPQNKLSKPVPGANQMQAGQRAQTKIRPLWNFGILYASSLQLAFF